mmetsp:Transcript_114357/g.207984  ORF Transcript_114357/g.207984 Transcript_114357/m.207984 type:complete len:86 (-) Transcript_114357:1273-1530(-)
MKPKSSMRRSNTRPLVDQSTRLENGMTLLLLLDDHLEVLVDDCDSEKNTCATANCAEEICDNRETTNAGTPESGGNRNIAVQLPG